MKLKVFCVAAFLLLFGSVAFAQQAKSMRGKTDPITVGETAPDFALRDENGKSVKLSKMKGTTVLVFYRAYWCPYCIRQLADMRSLVKPGDNFRILGISPDPTERARETRSKIAKDGKGDLTFPLLSDAGSKTINEYGLYDPTYAGKEVDGVPRPAVIILDKNRKVLWARVEMDYKKRPTLDEIRAELERIKG